MIRAVLVTPPNVDGRTIALLEAGGCRVIRPAKAESDIQPEEWPGLLAGARGWIIGPHARVTRELVAAAPECRVFIRRGVGHERLDMEAIRDLGRVGAIAAGGNEDSVADHAVGLMLAVARRVREQQIAMLAGDWSIRVSGDLFRKTVGIVGMGRTGRALARRLAGFECRVLATTPRPDGADGVEFVDLPTLLRQSDFVSLHAPLTPATRHMIDARALAAMKQGAILVNTGRGGLVDDAALLTALRAGHPAGAGLDVFEAESDPAARDTAMQLLALPNVVGTPHSAASTREGLARTNEIAARCVLAVLDGVEPPPGCVVVDGRR